MKSGKSNSTNQTRAYLDYLMASESQADSNTAEVYSDFSIPRYQSIRGQHIPLTPLTLTHSPFTGSLHFHLGLKSIKLQQAKQFKIVSYLVHNNKTVPELFLPTAVPPHFLNSISNPSPSLTETHSSYFSLAYAPQFTFHFSFLLPHPLLLTDFSQIDIESLLMPPQSCATKSSYAIVTVHFHLPLPSSNSSQIGCITFASAVLKCNSSFLTTSHQI